MTTLLLRKEELKKQQTAPSGEIEVLIAKEVAHFCKCSPGLLYATSDFYTVVFFVVHQISEVFVWTDTRNEILVFFLYKKLNIRKIKNT